MIYKSQRGKPLIVASQCYRLQHLDNIYKLTIMKQFIASAAIFAATVSAIPVWQQCGGQDWTGSGSCDSGSTCIKLNNCKLQR